MEAVITNVFDTEWGLIAIGICLIAAIIFEFFSNKPKT